MAVADSTDETTSSAREARFAAALSGPRAASATLIALTFVLTFVLRYPSLFEPHWYGDEGIFASVAAEIRRGGMLYSGAWDNKPPLIYYTYAGVQAAFGTGIFPLHMTATAVVLATQAALIATALMLYGAWRAAIAGAIFALLLGTPLIEGDVAMTETFMILPATLAVLLFVRRELRDLTPRPPLRVRRGGDDAGRRALAEFFAIGVLVGIAAGYKQVAVFDGLAIAVMVWLLHRRPLRALGAMAAGVALPQLALAALFLATGAFTAYWYAIVGSLPLYARLGPSDSALVRFAAYLPALLVVTVLARRRDAGRAITIASFPALWLAFAVAGVLSSTFAFPHYMQQAAPALALALVSAPFRYERDDIGQLGLAVAGVLVAAVLYGQFAPAYRHRTQVRPIAYYHTFVSHQWGSMSDIDYDYHFDGDVVAVHDIAAAMRAGGGGGTLFSWSEQPWLYADTGARNPTRYYTSFLGDEVPGAKPEIMRDLRARPPAYVLISDSAYAPFEDLESFVRARYTLVRAQGDWRLYRRAR